MAATHAALSTYELVENIIAHLPETYVYRAAQVSKPWRTIAAESPAVAELLEPLRPLTPGDLKVIAAEEVFDEEISKYFKLGFVHPHDPVGYDIANAKPSKKKLVLDMFSAFSATSKCVMRWRPFNLEPQRGLQYSRVGEGARISIDTRLKPESIPDWWNPTANGLETPVGDLMKMVLPPTNQTQAVLGPPEHFITSPPVTAVGLKLGKRDNCVACTVYVSKGVRFVDVVQAQKAMLKAHYEYDSDVEGEAEPECFAYIKVKVWIDRIRREPERERGEQPSRLGVINQVCISGETRCNIRLQLYHLGGV